MRAGTLRKRLTIQTAVPTDDPQWGKVDSWQDGDTVWAEVIPASGSEVTKDQGVQASTKYTIRMRYRADLTSENRLKFKGKILGIVSVVNDQERNRELLIEAVEHAGAEVTV